MSDGRRMQVVYQTSANLVRKTQAIVKQALGALGIEVEAEGDQRQRLFLQRSGEPRHTPFLRGYADVFPAASWDRSAGYMRRFASWEIAQKANNWTGQNIVRWSNAEYDRLWQQAKTELDAVSAPPSSSA